MRRASPVGAGRDAKNLGLIEIWMSWQQSPHVQKMAYLGEKTPSHPTSTGALTMLRDPTINRSTNVRGYSPVQWVLGCTPHVPGLPTEELLAPSRLEPSEEFLNKLQNQKAAANAVFAADVDTRLRRALNRKYTGQLAIYQLGDLCYYCRDGPGGIGPKLLWRGPARVVMVEQLEAGN